MIMLGTHKPQQQATLTKQIKILEIFFRFRFRYSIEKNILNPGIFFFRL